MDDGHQLGDDIAIRGQSRAPCALAHRGRAGIMFPVESTVDSFGRVGVPKVLRDALGLRAGTKVDITRYGAGLQLTPSGRTARLVDESDVLVATGQTEIDDDTVFGLIDTSRR